MLLGRAWFPSHPRGREKKTGSPVSWTRPDRFADAKEIVTLCVLANTAARTSTSKSIQRYQSSHAISSFAAIENAFTLWFAPSPLHRINGTARHGRARIAFAFAPKTIPFVVVSKDEVGLTARACETSRDERACARGTSNWLKTVITEPRFESAHYFGGDVKGTSTCDWSKERNCRAAEVQRSAVDEKHANACANSDTESAHYYFIPNRSVVLIAKSTRDARLIKARSI